MMPAYDLALSSLDLAFSLLAATVPAMVAGVVAAEILIAMRVTEKIGRITLPLTRFAHLPSLSGTSFLLAFLSPKAANAMLVDIWKREEISKEELYLASLMNSFPSVVMHWRYLLPVYVPLLGLWGLLYFLILMAVGFLKTGIVMCWGRWRLAPQKSIAAPEETAPVSLHEAVGPALSSARHVLVRVLSLTVPTLVIIAFLIQAGVFDAITAVLQETGRFLPVPSGGFAVITAQFGSYIAGAGAASALLAAGDLTGEEVVLTLLIGNILSSVSRSVRWYGSSYAAIFGPKTGAEILTISMLLRNGIMIAVVLLLAGIW